jgi:ferric-dicitrate binding protein FerR (iron transport regulator)
MIKEILIKLISSNKYTNNFCEISEIIENKKLHSEYLKLKNIWALSTYKKQRSEKQIDIEYKKLERIISTSENRVSKHIFKIVKYAAIVIMIFLSGYFVNSQLNNGYNLNSNKIIAPLGQSTQVVLSDGTKVHLNSGSVLRFSEFSNNTNRKVYLDGEAYFEVTSDKTKMFIVETQKLDFKVFGTSFNIEAYKNQDYTKVALIEGSLGVFGKNDIEIYRLLPNQIITCNLHKNSFNIQKNENMDMYVGWREGIASFKNEPLINISKKLERWYNVKIIFEDKKIEDKLFTGSIIKNKPIYQIMEVFKFSSNINYRIDNNKNGKNTITLFY